MLSLNAIHGHALDAVLSIPAIRISGYKMRAGKA